MQFNFAILLAATSAITASASVVKPRHYKTPGRRSQSANGTPIYFNCQNINQCQTQSGGDMQEFASVRDCLQDLSCDAYFPGSDNNRGQLHESHYDLRVRCEEAEECQKKWTDQRGENCSWKDLMQCVSSKTCTWMETTSTTTVGTTSGTVNDSSGDGSFGSLAVRDH